MSSGRRGQASRAPPPSSHSRGRKGPPACSPTQDSGISLHPPPGGASGLFWQLLPRRGPGLPGVPWRILRLVASCVRQDRRSRCAHGAHSAQGGTGGLFGRKEDELRDRTPRPMTRGQNWRLWACGATCRAPMRSPQPLALPFPRRSGERLCGELLTFWHPVGGEPPTHPGIVNSFNEFLRILCAWHRAGRWGNPDA